MEGFIVLKTDETDAPDATLTWRQVKEVLDKLPDERLDDNVLIWKMPEDEGFEQGADGIASGWAKEVWLATEDMINPSGDGVEPISLYEDEPDLLESEDVVLKNGAIVLIY